jgi:hypothetical protein
MNNPPMLNELEIMGADDTFELRIKLDGCSYTAKIVIAAKSKPNRAVAMSAFSIGFRRRHKFFLRVNSCQDVIFVPSALERGFADVVARQRGHVEKIPHLNYDIGLFGNDEVSKGAES